MSTRLAVLLVLAALPWGCAGDEPPVPPSGPAAEPQQSVRAELRALCETLRGGSDPYYGRAQLDELSGYLTRESSDPRGPVVVRARLGMELLRLGDSAQAVERLEDARRLALEARLDPPLVRDVTRRLALARLRLGEQNNCIGMHGPASCIVPFRAEGVHRDPAPVEAALTLYLELLGDTPGDTTLRWLANVAAMAAGRHPAAVPAAHRIDPARLASPADIGRFPDRAWDAGLRVTRPSGGALMDDFDGDGNLDVITSTIDPCGPMSFFRNDGRGRFEDRSAESGLDAQLGGLNLIHADYDNDGDLDLFVLRGGWMGEHGRMRNSLLRNDGGGRFEDVTRAAGLAATDYPTQTGAFADYDGDGDLDLYVGNESLESLYAGGLGRGTGAFPSQLFRNEGDGTFTEIAAAAGVTNDRFAKGVAWGDYDNDGDPDLYVSNIGPNRLYRNDGGGRFTDVAESLGVVEPAGRSFATWFFDYDNDGDLDLFVADYGAGLDDVTAHYAGAAVEAGRPRLYRNDGTAGFTEIGREAGLTVPVLPMGANFGDLDNDGWPDLYLGTGTPSYESITPNLMYRNVGGRRFEDVTYSGGFGHLQKGHGVAFGDIDNDGDQDLFEQMGGAYPGDAYPSVLYENPGHGRAWVTLRLEGVSANRSAIGARLALTLRTPRGTRTVHAVVGSGGSFGGSSLQQELGLGDAEAIERLEIAWPGGGAPQRIAALAVNRVYRIRQGESPVEVGPFTALTLGGR